VQTQTQLLRPLVAWYLNQRVNAVGRRKASVADVPPGSQNTAKSEHAGDYKIQNQSEKREPYRYQYQINKTCSLLSEAGTSLLTMTLLVLPSMATCIPPSTQKRRVEQEDPGSAPFECVWQCIVSCCCWLLRPRGRQPTLLLTTMPRGAHDAWIQHYATY